LFCVKEEVELIPGRLWIVLFVSITIGFLADTFFVIKGLRKKRMGIFDVLTSLSVPYFIVSMLIDEELTTNERIINSVLAFLCVASGIIHIYILKKKLVRNRKGQ
jgi:hypothetical protein